MTSLAVGRCGKKLSYRNRIDALVAGATLLKCRPGVAESRMFRAYRCDRCKKWHLTKQEKRGGGD